jgi:hypothetical protein
LVTNISDMIHGKDNIIPFRYKDNNNKWFELYREIEQKPLALERDTLQYMSDIFYIAGVHIIGIS